MIVSLTRRSVVPRVWSWWSYLPLVWQHVSYAARQIPDAQHAASGRDGHADRAVLAQAQDFECFFLKFEPQVTGYLWRMTGDQAMASDLCQETFLRAWQHFEKIRHYDKPGAWLMRVATNLALQHLRRRTAPVGAAQSLDKSFDPGVSDPGGRIAMRDLVRETLLALPDKPRAMLILREVYGFSGDEVAQTLGMSRAAVKVALWRARAQFRTAYLRKDGGQ
ncbi:MAG: RNA polymerase sigma factor [Ktedonobacterales bacterium]